MAGNSKEVSASSGWIKKPMRCKYKSSPNEDFPAYLQVRESHKTSSRTAIARGRGIHLDGNLALPPHLGCELCKREGTTCFIEWHEGEDFNIMCARCSATGRSVKAVKCNAIDLIFDALYFDDVLDRPAEMCNGRPYQSPVVKQRLDQRLEQAARDGEDISGRNTGNGIRLRDCKAKFDEINNWYVKHQRGWTEAEKQNIRPAPSDRRVRRPNKTKRNKVQGKSEDKATMKDKATANSGEASSLLDPSSSASNSQEQQIDHGSTGFTTNDNHPAANHHQESAIDHLPASAVPFVPFVPFSMMASPEQVQYAIEGTIYGAFAVARFDSAIRDTEAAMDAQRIQIDKAYEDVLVARTVAEQHPGWSHAHVDHTAANNRFSAATLALQRSQNRHSRLLQDKHSLVLYMVGMKEGNASFDMYFSKLGEGGVLGERCWEWLAICAGFTYPLLADVE